MPAATRFEQRVRVRATSQVTMDSSTKRKRKPAQRTVNFEGYQDNNDNNNNNNNPTEEYYEDRNVDYNKELRQQITSSTPASPTNISPAKPAQAPIYITERFDITGTHQQIFKAQAQQYPTQDTVPRPDIPPPQDTSSFLSHDSFVKYQTWSPNRQPQYPPHPSGRGRGQGQHPSPLGPPGGRGQQGQQMHPLGRGSGQGQHPSPLGPSGRGQGQHPSPLGPSGRGQQGQQHPSPLGPGRGRGQNPPLGRGGRG
ncbi:hypothetical protein QBC45DRAFT_433187 [Copromyces sp. CBS 386.78]|nr:hypothetical protein QBC45DRAFT_433187 [Copromyces sp. CBS 386.78]